VISVVSTGLLVTQFISTAKAFPGFYYVNDTPTATPYPTSTITQAMLPSPTFTFHEKRPGCDHASVLWFTERITGFCLPDSVLLYNPSPSQYNYTGDITSYDLAGDITLFNLPKPQVFAANVSVQVEIRDLSTSSCAGISFERGPNQHIYVFELCNEDGNAYILRETHIDSHGHHLSPIGSEFLGFTEDVSLTATIFHDDLLFTIGGDQLISLSILELLILVLEPFTFS